jgi:single-stranded-DNA-specific exonuclease
LNKKIAFREVENNSSKEPLSRNAVLDKVYRARGINQQAELEKDLKKLLPFTTLKDIDRAVARLQQAFEQQQKIIIVGDYDTDGATSTTIAVRALRMFGLKQVSYLVPNRFEFGYGLSAKIVELAAKENPDLIITVDNGIVSFEGVDKANELGIDVIVTDHHLAGDGLPKACAVVNPNQPGDEFPSKNLAGCGVIFYVMLALRAKLREIDWFKQQGMEEPNMGSLVDIVALGTVADVVPLDANNRLLVHFGLQRIRAQRCVPGIKALLGIGKRKLPRVVASDLGFAVAPRLNAAGRLEDMSLGIECLLADNPLEAEKLAFQLEELNLERRTIEASMKRQAFEVLDKLNFNESKLKSRAICVFDKTFHQGVIGIVASRLKDHYHRPTVVFAAGDNGEIKGSARSIPGFHIRDAFERIALTNPGLLSKYGGHAMAAGLTIAEKDFTKFQQAFIDDAQQHIAEKDLTGQVLCDCQLEEDDFNLDLANLLRDAGPWGQGFPEPMFANRFRIVEQRLVGEKHLKMTLAFQNKIIGAILFNADLNCWPNHRCEYAQVAYRLDVNEFQGRTNLQLMVEHLEPCNEPESG